jgi:4-hydroxy-3-methylbut-2-enyl diphosphate reductase
VKTRKRKNNMKIRLARHYGMCFGVRDALRKAHAVAEEGPVTVLGELVHNPVVQRHLGTLGVKQGELEEVGSSGTEVVMITAHGASDRAKQAWEGAGYRVTDTTCPLVRKAHHALAKLVVAGYHPVVIGAAGHVEVRGLTGDFPGATVVAGEEDLAGLPEVDKFGVVSQTTQPVKWVEWLVARLRELRPAAEVVFRNTVCQPTRDRQESLEALCRESELVIVVGGRHSNNTRQLVETARGLGCRAWQVETAEDVDAGWLDGVEAVGVTAGTSTLDETVEGVVLRLRELAASRAVVPRLAESVRQAIARHFPVVGGP